MQFKTAADVEEVCWYLKLADIPRGKRRAMINDLANGAPPYTPTEAKDNNIEVNSSSLSLTSLTHDARMQFMGAMTKSENFFTARTDYGVRHKRMERSVTFTNLINKPMKRSIPYFETLRAKFGNSVLHGIGPSRWQNRDKWCDSAIGVEDVLIPSGTTLPLENLPFIALYCPWTGMQLNKLTRNTNRDPGWNMDAVNSALKWADEQAHKLGGWTGNEQWAPEKWVERYKENSGYMASDRVPTIDCWDFYFWDDEDGEAGWRRRIIFDAEGGQGYWAGSDGKTMPSKNLVGDRNAFLYDSKARVYAKSLSEIVHFQFADLSAVFPARYHSQRGLGFMLYEPCHLENRMHCKFNEAAQETMMPYIRVDSADDAERALSISLATRGLIDKSVHFLTAAERWQVNQALAESAIGQNQRIIDRNSSAWVQNQNYSQDRTEKTKFQVMAEVNAMTTLISQALSQAYTYQEEADREHKRRFLKKDSEDPEVRQFRNECLNHGIPEKLLVPEAWEVKSEKIMGAGNRTMEMAIAQQLMEWLPYYPPASQEKIKRIATLAITDSVAITNELLPQTPTMSTRSRFDATTAIPALMEGFNVPFSDDENRVEIIETLIPALATMMQQTEAAGGMPTPERLLGYQTVFAKIRELEQGMLMDKAVQPKLKQWDQELGFIENLLTGYAQRLQEQQTAQGNGQPQIDPKDMQKIQAKDLETKLKLQNMMMSRQERAHQKQKEWAASEARKSVTHEADLRRQDSQHESDLRRTSTNIEHDVLTKDLEAAAALERDAAAQLMTGRNQEQL